MMSPAPSSNLFTRQLMRQSLQCQEQPSVKDESLSNALNHPGLSPFDELSASGLSHHAFSREQLKKENDLEDEAVVYGRQDPSVQHNQNLVWSDNPEIDRHSQNLVKLDNPDLCSDVKEEFASQKCFYEDHPDGLVERGSGGGSNIYRPGKKDSSVMGPNIGSGGVKEQTNFSRKSVFPKSIPSSVSKIETNDNERACKIENNKMNTADIKGYQSTVINNRRNIGKVRIGNVGHHGVNNTGNESHQYIVRNNKLITDKVGIGRPNVENNEMSSAGIKSHQYTTDNRPNTDNLENGNVKSGGMNTAGIESHHYSANNRINTDKEGIDNVENHRMNAAGIESHQYTTINRLNTDNFESDNIKSGRMNTTSIMNHQDITSDKPNKGNFESGNVKNGGKNTAIESHQYTTSNRLNTFKEGDGNYEHNVVNTTGIKNREYTTNNRLDTDKEGIGNFKNNGVNIGDISGRKYRVATEKPNRLRPATGFMNDLRVLENVSKWNASAASKSKNIREVKDNVSLALGEGGANSKNKDVSAHNPKPNFCLQEKTYPGYSREVTSKIDRLPSNQSSIQSCGFSNQVESEKYIVKDEESERKGFFGKNKLTVDKLSSHATLENTSVISECQRSDDKKKSPKVPVETGKIPVKVHGQRNSISHKQQSTFCNTEIDIEKFNDFFNISKNDKPWGQAAITAMPRASTSQHMLQGKSTCLNGDGHNNHSSLAKERTLQSMAKTENHISESQMTSNWHIYSEGSSGIRSHYQSLLHPPEKPFGSMEPYVTSACCSTHFSMSPHSQLFHDDTGQFDPHSHNTFLSSDSSLERESLPSSTTSLTSEKILQTCETATSSPSVTSRVEKGTCDLSHKINSFTEIPHPQVSKINSSQAFNLPSHLETCKNTVTSLEVSNNNQLSTETNRLKDLKVTTSISTSETYVSPNKCPPQQLILFQVEMLMLTYARRMNLKLATD